MDDKTGCNHHLAFTDAEINAAASISKATSANGVRLHHDTAIEAYGPPFDPASDAVYTQPQRQGLDGVTYSGLDSSGNRTGATLAEI